MFQPLLLFNLTLEKASPSLPPPPHPKVSLYSQGPYIGLIIFSSLQYSVYSIQSTVYSIQSTVYSIQSTVYSLQSSAE